MKKELLSIMRFIIWFGLVALMIISWFKDDISNDFIFLFITLMWVDLTNKIDNAK